jgi:hypothetical protein
VKEQASKEAEIGKLEVIGEGNIEEGTAKDEFQLQALDCFSKRSF